jgi:hypothetical protein
LSVMAKVFGVVPLELRPGIKGEDFEKFCNCSGHKAERMPE